MTGTIPAPTRIPTSLPRMEDHPVVTTYTIPAGTKVRTVSPSRTHAIHTTRVSQTFIEVRERVASHSHGECWFFLRNDGWVVGVPARDVVVE